MVGTAGRGDRSGRGHRQVLTEVGGARARRTLGPAARVCQTLQSTAHICWMLRSTACLRRTLWFTSSTSA